MAVPFATLENEVTRLRNFILGDLRTLLNREQGANYMAAALITCACETLAHLKYGVRQGERFFAELLPPEYNALSSCLYNAIRNGIVHLYDTQTIRVGARKIEIVVSWRKMPHLYQTPDGHYLYVNVQDLGKELRAAVDRFELQLRQDPSLRETFAKGMLESREFHVNRDRASIEQALAALKIGPPFPPPAPASIDPSLKPDPNLKGSYYRRIEDIQRAIEALGVDGLPDAVQFLAYYFGCEKLALGVVGIHKRWPATTAYHHRNQPRLKDIQEAATALGLSIAQADVEWLFAGFNEQAQLRSSGANKNSARELRNRLIHDLGLTNVKRLAEHARFHIPKLKTFLGCANQVLEYQKRHFSNVP